MANGYEIVYQFISYCHVVILSAGCSKDDRDSGALWPVDMKFFISNCHVVILLAGCSIDERDSGVLWPMKLSFFISYCHDLSRCDCSIDDSDSGVLVAKEYEIVY